MDLYQPKMEAILYARVSSKDQEQEGYSIPSQLKLLREYAQKEGFEVIREFIDVETAKQAGRTSFAEMVKYIEDTPSFKVVLVEKTDRLYRNFRDYVTIDDLMREGLSVHLVKEGEVLSRDARSHQKFIHGIKVLLAKNYVDNLSEETRKGMQEKAEQGIYPSIAPLGYPNVQCDSRKFIQPDPKLVHCSRIQLHTNGGKRAAANEHLPHSAGLRQLLLQYGICGIVNSGNVDRV